jgi:hypothetical protein
MPGANNDLNILDCLPLFKQPLNIKQQQFLEQQEARGIKMLSMVLVLYRFFCAFCLHFFVALKLIIYSFGLLLPFLNIRHNGKF